MRTLRAPALCLLVAACSTIAVPATTGSSGTPPPSDPGSTAIANEIVRETNYQRVSMKLPVFVVSPRLMEAARLHAQQMAQYQRMEHTISAAQYPTLQSRLQAVGYSYATAAENVAWNSPSAQAVVGGWMNSAGHRANILNPGLTEIGTAMARSSKGESYWIQVFGTPR